MNDAMFNCADSPLFNSHNGRVQGILKEIQSTLASELPTLFLGERGTGKTLFARAKYTALRKSRKITGDFIKENCAKIADGSLGKSELFGHVRGAFTGADTNKPGKIKAADGGVLFLDEVGDLVPQAEMLTAMEEGEFTPLGGTEAVQSNFLLVTATNKNLFEEVAAKRFRADLLDRIAGWVHTIPPLRERREDIQPFVDQKLKGRQIEFITSAHKQFFEFALSADASWLGNWRDLNNIVERMIYLAKNGKISTDIVANQTQLLRTRWSTLTSQPSHDLVEQVLGAERSVTLTRHDRARIRSALESVATSKSWAEAATKEFAVPGQPLSNPTARMQKFLFEAMKLDAGKMNALLGSGHSDATSLTRTGSSFTGVRSGEDVLQDACS
jgi:transcriptional regulatory protein RtcR